MSNRRKLVIALGVSALAAPFHAFSQQQPGKVWRIGFLGVGSAGPYAERIEALRAGLRAFGYAEGRNVTIEYVWAENNYERLPQLVNELSRVKVDVIVTHSGTGVRAARQAATGIPIVMTDVGDAVGSGHVDSLARPGGSITGSTYLGPQLSTKRLEILKEVMPRIARTGWLVNSNNPGFANLRKHMVEAAQAMKVELHEFDVRPAGLDSALQAIAKRRVDALLIQEDPLFTSNIGAITKAAQQQRLPLIGFSQFADAGGMIGFGVNFPELYRRAAYFVDKILKGAKPADLPVEQATKFELIVNMKSARALGITIPQSVLVRAERVIE